MLSEFDSWNCAPMRLAAIIAGASCGDMVTAWFRATDSIGGTSTFKATVSSSQAMSIGTANLRTNRYSCGLHQAGCLGSVPGRGLLVLDHTIDRDAAPDVVAIAL